MGKRFFRGKRGTPPEKGLGKRRDAGSTKSWGVQ